MKIVIAGASGFLGHALQASLRQAGHDVFCLVRRRTATPAEIWWEPSGGHVDTDRVEGADAIINLAGANIAGGRWTAARREELLRSRVNATRTLVLSLKGLQRKPKIFINASAIGYYGDTGEDEVTERSSIGQGFLPELCLAWETHAEGAARLGIRTAVLRYGVVLGKEGGALAKMLPVFRWGLGGRLGRGQQWMSWLSLADAIRIIHYVLEAPGARGAYNAVAPNPVRNASFSLSLAKLLRRPMLLPAPEWALRLAFGAMAAETVLASARIRPERLLAEGYKFTHPTVEEALQATLG